MTRLAWVVVVFVALAYPLVTLATDGVTFPRRDDCVRPTLGEGEVDAVFGYFDDQRAAAELRDRALGVGFEGTEVMWNGCGRLRVVLSGIESVEIARDFAGQARAVGLEVTLEQSG